MSSSELIYTSLGLEGLNTRTLMQTARQILGRRFFSFLCSGFEETLSEMASFLATSLCDEKIVNPDVCDTIIQGRIYAKLFNSIQPLFNSLLFLKRHKILLVSIIKDKTKGISARTMQDIFVFYLNYVNLSNILDSP